MIAEMLIIGLKYKFKDEPLEVVVKALSNKYRKYEVKFHEIRKCPLRTMSSYKSYFACSGNQHKH
ncbi:hypothetical protein NQ315_014464 [Exocentrus adspersus]|uniref:Uncharacterized protein n=1 Tax=Exocentrus adspersus TaxID=1586481 RepID=A0AAV8VE22_9CUCU|nr:hypothetical protein NQ315_014464 [Exocentrus adspersus]